MSDDNTEDKTQETDPIKEWMDKHLIIQVVDLSNGDDE